MSKQDRDSPVGIIGLGIMGGAIGRNLVAAGWRVIGHDIDAARRAEAKAAGIEIADGAAKLAERARTILVSLPSPQALRATAEAIAAAKLPKRIVAEMSTFALADKVAAEEMLRAAGHVMLDCPISGTGSQAKVKDLVIYASGEREAVTALEPIFADFSRQAHDLGAFGNGTKMKFVANLLVAIHNVASAEAFVLGIKAGLDPKQIFELISAGAGTSRIFELRGPMMAENRYDDVTMSVKIWQKDMTVIGDFARDLGCPTPLFSASGPIYAAAMATGHGGDDTASVCAVLEAMAGIRRQ
jgi:putative dehydrogenase